MTDQRSASDAYRLRHSGWHGVVRATIGYIAIVYAVWVCYYALTDFAAGDFRPAPIMFGLFTTLAALIIVGIPTIVGTAIVLLLRPRVRPMWLAPMSVLVTFGPSLFWWVQPNTDNNSVLIQQIAQALHLAYLLILLRRARHHGIFG